jgi:LCP family protein required for cell wall assembly
MRDGDHATRGPLRASGAADDDRLRPIPPSFPDAAPWERWQRPATGPQAAAPRSRARAGAALADDDAPTGSHAGSGPTVAELIAKVGAPAPGRYRAGRDLAPSRPRQNGETRGGPYASEIPDLDELLHRRPPATDHLDGEPATAPPEAAPSHPTEAPQTQPASRRRLAALAGRAFAVLLAVVALVSTGGAWEWSTSKNNKLNTVKALDPHSQDIVDPGGQYGDENFLIVGADTRAGENGGVGAGDSDDTGGARSDTIMLVNIPANRKRVAVVSFPRDLAINPLYCEAWNPDTGEYGPVYDEKTGTYSDDMIYTETKLNSAYSYGGPECLVKEVQKLSGLSINRFIAVDFAGFAKMVDTLGGVDVCSPSPLYDYELGTVLDSSGHQVIDGATALNYVRARSVTTEFNGDYGRIKRQQLFLSSLLRSLISKDTFFSLTKLNNVVDMFINDSYVDNVKTKDLVALGQSLQGVSAGHITFVTVPTGDTDDNGDEPPRTADMRALFDAIIDDDPLPGEPDQNTTSPATTSSSTAAPNPSEQLDVVTVAPPDVTVQVFNSTSESGLATKTNDALENRGFNVLSPDDYPNSLKSTTVLFSPGNERAAATVASAFGNAPMQRVKGKGQVVQVVLGPDFRSVSAPAPAGLPVPVHVTRATSSVPAELPDDLTVTNAADTTCE